MPAQHRLKAVKAKRKKALKFKVPKQLALFKIFALVLLIGTLGFLGKTLYSSWSHRVWVSNTRVTVVVASVNPKLYSFDPQSGKLISITIPKNTQVDTTSGFGQWLAGSLWGLGSQEKMGGELMRLSLQKSLSIPIDAWVDAQGENMFKPHTLGWISAGWEAFTLSNLKSNLTFFDRANILSRIAQTKLSDRRNIDLEAQGVIVGTKLSDGEAGFVIVPERTKVTLDILRDTLVYEEGKKIVVENATGKNGVGGNVAQIGSVLGVRVIGAKTSEEEIENCKILGEGKQLNSVSAQRLKQIFSCSLEEKKPSGPQDLEIWLGREFRDRF